MGRHLTAVAVACLCLLQAGLASAAGFEIRDGHVRVEQEVYLLDVDFAVELSEDARDALENGVPLTISVDLLVIRPRNYLWDETVASVAARYRLRVHALSDQFVVENLSTGAYRTFGRLEHALDALGTIRDFPLLDTHLLDSGQDYALRLRVRLDIEALPAPLRPLAYLSSRWRLSSDWSEWPLEQ